MTDMPWSVCLTYTVFATTRGRYQVLTFTLVQLQGTQIVPLAQYDVPLQARLIPTHAGQDITILLTPPLPLSAP